MDEQGEAIYRYLKVNLTAESLKELSLKLIEAYKAKNVLRLKLFAESILLDAPRDDEGESRLFLRLIKFFHPDRLNFFLKDIDESLLMARAQEEISEQEIFNFKILSYIRLFYKVLIPLVIGFMLVHQGLDLLTHFRKRH